MSLSIMPLGDSITFGYPGANGGYRGPLHELLKTAGIDFGFVGSSTANWAVNGLPAKQTHQQLEAYSHNPWQSKYQ